MASQSIPSKKGGEDPDLLLSWGKSNRPSTRGTMLYWNRDHRGRAVSFFFDFSLALAIRNLNTFAELTFIVDLLPKTKSQDAYQRDSGLVGNRGGLRS